jgi:hypothetical protein
MCCAYTKHISHYPHRIIFSILTAISTLWYFIYLFFITRKKAFNRKYIEITDDHIISTELAFHSSQVLKLQTLFHKAKYLHMGDEKVINKLTVTISQRKINHQINPSVLVDIISIKLYFTYDKRKRSHTEFHCVFIFSQSKQFTAQAPHNQETLDLLLQCMSVVELGHAAVELAGTLEAAVVGVTACQNRPCPFLAGLSMG